MQNLRKPLVFFLQGWCICYRLNPAMFKMANNCTFVKLMFLEDTVN